MEKNRKTTTKKRRILVLADSPTVSTGFATVTKNVLKELYDSGEFEIDMVGINYDGTFDKEEFEKKYYFINKLIPAHRVNSADMYGREYTLMALTGAFPEIRPPYDIFFTIQDHFILQAQSKDYGVGFAQSIYNLQQNTLKSKFKDNHFVWVGYYPIDSIIKKDWVDECMSLTTFPVAYCNFGAEQILRFKNEENKLDKRLSIIRHGTNTKDFFPISDKEKKEFRKKYFKMMNDDDFLIINVNRNQIRKDLLRTLLVYKEFKKKVPNSYLYLHCKNNDQGGNLFDIAKNIGLDEGDFALPKNFSAHKGIPIEILNKIYNVADACISTTLGEGWGLSFTESMATKTPIFAPNITSVPEIFNTENGFDENTARGICFEAGKTDSELICYGSQDNENVRPITNVKDASEKLYWAYKNPDKVKKIVDRAYKYATELTWKNECKKWVSLFKKACLINDQLKKNGKINGIAENEKNVYVTNGQKPNKIGRNDYCPLCLEQGIKIKVKKCEKHAKYFLK